MHVVENADVTTPNLFRDMILFGLFWMHKYRIYYYILLIDNKKYNKIFNYLVSEISYFIKIRIV